MSKNKELSAIDAIYSLLDEVQELRREVKAIDSNIKLLNNKILKMSQGTVPTIPTASAAVPAGPTAVPVSVPVKAASQSEPASTIKLFGRIKNQAKKPIKGVYIKIYDASGNVIKSRETDSEGYWEARVAAGSYGVELDARHINKKFLPKNINISVNDSMSEFEVK